MSTLADLYNNQATQNPSIPKTPLQMAYENLLNAQANARNTTSDEWGSAIGNSVNGLGKILASAVISNPYQKAGATNSLTMADDRQDRLIKEWLDRRMNNRNDFVQQAKEQLGLETANEEKDYQRGLQKTQAEISAQQYADKLAQIQQEYDLKKANQDEIARHNKAMEDIARAGLDAGKGTTKDLSPEEKITTETNTKTKLQLQNDIRKAVAEKDAFEEKIKGLENLKTKQGNALSRAWQGATGWYTGKGDAIYNSQNLISELKQATLDAFGVSPENRGDKAKVNEMFAQVGIPKGSAISPQEADEIAKRIRQIYVTRINKLNNELNRFDNPTQLDIANDDTTGGL